MVNVQMLMLKMA